MQVVQILSGDLSCIKGTRKNQIPFLRKAFREELIRAEQPRMRDVLMEHLQLVGKGQGRAVDAQSQMQRYRHIINLWKLEAGSWAGRIEIQTLSILSFIYDQSIKGRGFMKQKPERDCHFLVKYVFVQKGITRNCRSIVNLAYMPSKQQFFL